MEKTDARFRLEKQLRAATSPWDRLPILIALTRELNRKDPESVHRYAVEAFTLAKELNDPFWTACSLCAVSLHLSRLSRHSECLHNFKKASGIFAQLNNFRMKAEADMIIARTYMTLGDFDSAMPMLLELLNFFKSMQEPYWITITLCYIGDIYRMSGDWNTGLKHYRQASRVMQKTGSRSDGSMVYHRLAASYRVMEDSERYRKYMFMSLAICRENNEKSGIAIAFGNIGNSYLDQELFTKAEPYVRQSLKLYRELGYVAYEAMAWARLGTIYEHRGEFDKAFRCFRKGLSLARTCEEKLILGQIYENFGMLCVKMGRTAQGFSYLHKSIAIINRAGQPNDRYKAYEALSTACEMTGDAGAALEHYRQAVKIKEEYLSSEKMREAAYTEMRNRFQPLARKLKKEQSKNDTLKKIIKQKEAELLSLTLSMVQNEEEHSNAKRRGPARRTATPHKNRSNGLSENWETFARQFHKVHHDFYTSLVRQYPVLTATEVKVCSLIRIGLSSKEIAGILCVSRRTVDSHRVRIHKKMALPSRASLAGFIVGL